MYLSWCLVHIDDDDDLNESLFGASPRPIRLSMVQAHYSNLCEKPGHTIGIGVAQELASS